jgi:hypothetical protein
MEYTTKVFEDRVEHYLGGKLNDIVINGKVVPAIECANGSKAYYKDGKCHRDDDPVLGPMPAIEHANGSKHYFKNGKLHRDDNPVLGPMPAIECADGDKSYYKDGIEFTPSKPDQLKIKLIKMMDELDLIIKSLN